MMQVVNKRTIGKINPLTDYYIGRGSLLGNPFTVTEFGRDKAIYLYKIHFRYMKANSQEFRDELIKASKFQRLVCYCAPLNCHGDFIWLQIEDFTGSN